MRRMLRRTSRLNESAIRRYPRRHFREDIDRNDITRHEFKCEIDVIVNSEDSISSRRTIQEYASNLCRKIERLLRDRLRKYSIGVGASISRFPDGKTFRFEYTLSADMSEWDVSDFMNILEGAVSDSEEFMWNPVDGCTATFDQADYYESTYLAR